jgi:hypothetical protein
MKPDLILVLTPTLCLMRPVTAPARAYIEAAQAWWPTGKDHRPMGLGASYAFPSPMLNDELDSLISHNLRLEVL